MQTHRAIAHTSCSGCDNEGSDKVKLCLSQSTQNRLTIKFTRGYYRLDWVEITDENGDVIELNSLSASYQLDHTADYAHSNDYSDLAEPFLSNGVRTIAVLMFAIEHTVTHEKTHYVIAVFISIFARNINFAARL